MFSSNEIITRTLYWTFYYGMYAIPAIIFYNVIIVRLFDNVKDKFNK